VSAAPVLEAEALRVAYGGNLALDLPRLALGTGELVGVVGANGAGKSTLVNALLGWSRGRPAVSGRVRLDGEDIGALPTHARVRRGLLLVPEGGAVFSRLTVTENLAAAAAEHSGGRAYTEDEVFALFPRLRERLHHTGAQLSGGERQMLAIGRALRLGPRALVLDEPSIGLAPRLVVSVLDTVRRLVDERGLSVLLVEQNVRAAVEVVDRLVLIERGRILAEGPVATMRDDPRIIQAYLGESAA
jgi:branched-chain amino acid transport system ATP-binding protein